ncbi:MAG: DUF1868 domain-containing protein [Cyanobacteria bacterium SID2]|nr:DUF1868 domain-containing protein [Cyanobacteria bacterium SID2]MBP0005318.1 DUF1868 domain-containing protein [Cyanobacteria bacterium SBC]
MDDTYQVYLDRITRLIQTNTHATTLQHVLESPKFAPHPDGGRQAKPFPGYSIITPPWCDDSTNGEFYQAVRTCQENLTAHLDPNVFAPVPPDSFHVTLADLIWENTYRDAVATIPDFDERLRQCIANIFQDTQTHLSGAHPVRWKLVGIAVMTRAIAACLVPLDEASYDRVVRLRRAIYQNSELIRLGIEQQYYLTAHVTLGYFGNVSGNFDRASLSESLTESAEAAFQNAPPFRVSRAELRKFEDMTRYDRENNFPILML